MEIVDSASMARTGSTLEDMEDRIGFIRKVYGILATQLLVTALITLIPTLSAEARLWIAANRAVFWTMFAISIVIQCVLLCCMRVSRRVPINYILLLVFTLCEAYTVAFICTQYPADIVCLAAFMTAAVVISLSLYALYTKNDFTIFGGSLYILTAVLLMCSLALILLPRNHFLTILYSALGVIIFGFYLIFDTQLVAGGGRYELTEDDYIVGALILYLDIIMLFLHILKLLGNDKN